MKLDKRSQTLAAAFEVDPGFAWVFPDSVRRRRQLEVTFAGAVTHADRHGGVATVSNAAGVGVWMPHDKAVIRPIDAVRGGMLMLPFRIGLAAMGRLNAAEADGEHIVRQLVTQSSFAYLMALGVDPERQGEGLARQIVQQVETQARAAGYSVLALRTEQPRNISLYQHLGFELLGTAAARTSRLDVAVFSKPI